MNKIHAATILLFLSLAIGCQSFKPNDQYSTNIRIGRINDGIGKVEVLIRSNEKRLRFAQAESADPSVINSLRRDNVLLSELMEILEEEKRELVRSFNST